MPANTDFLAAVCVTSTVSEVSTCRPFLEKKLNYPPGFVLVLDRYPNDPTNLVSTVRDDYRNGDAPLVEGLWVSLEGTWSDNTTANLDQLYGFLSVYQLELALHSVVGRYGLRTTTAQINLLFGEETNVKSRLIDSVRIWWVPDYSAGNTTTPDFSEFPDTNGFTSADVVIISNATTPSCGESPAADLVGRNLSTDGISLASSPHVKSSVSGSLVLWALALLLLL